MRPAQLKGGASGFKFEGFAKVTMDVKCSRASILRSSFVKFSSSCGHLVRGSRSFQEFHRFHRFHMFGGDQPKNPLPALWGVHPIAPANFSSPLLRP
jgi:hypothetical protein